MIEKNLSKLALNVLYSKKEKYILLVLKIIKQIVRNKFFCRRMALSCTKITIRIIKRITSWWFFLSQLASLFATQNKRASHKNK